MEGEQNQTPTKTFKEDLMDVMALDQDGIQSFPPSTLPSSSLEGFQAISSQHTLLDMDLTGSFDLRPPISSSSQPSLGLTGFMDTLTLPQLSEMTRTQYQNLKDTLFTEVEELKTTMDTLTLHVDTASVKQTTEIKQLMSNQFEYFRKEFNNMLHWQLKNHHAEVLKDFNTVMEPMANTLDQYTTDQYTQQMNTFLAQTGSNSNLQNELHQCTQHFHQLAKDIEALKSSQQSSVKANVSVPTITSPSVSTVVEMPVVSTRLQRLHSTFQGGLCDSEPNSPSEVVTTVEGRGHFLGRQPVKIQFPCFGRLEDCDDPLIFLEKCYDFMALHPLSDEEVIATLRNVLHGTARDWWDVARLETNTWQEFEAKFLAAFLSEDYEDELAERVRTRVQQEGESIRDFAYMYRALCKRWKPQIEEDEVIKLILKNINPQMASQLRSNGVTSVDGLVRLGQQLEKDKENQLQYEQRKKPWKLRITSPAQSQLANPVPASVSQDSSKSPFCWRCKGPHAPNSCPQGGPAKNKNYKGQQGPNPVKGNHDNHPTVSTVTHLESVYSPTHPFSTSLPQQLIVPVNIDSWQGQALVDTGSSYTLLNEKLWVTMGYHPQQLRPWTEGPIYLADGGARQPLGWGEVQIAVQTLTVPLPVVVLAPQMLAFPVVLGLDYLFFSGLQMDIRNNVYWVHPDQKYYFLKNEAHFHEWHNSSPLALFSALPPGTAKEELNLLQVACQNTCLEERGKERFLIQLKQNSDVCTDVLGKTSVLTHRVYVNQDVPIRQKPYRVSPTKQKVIKQLIDEMLAADVIEPSSSAWSSPVVLIPKKTGGYRFCVDYRKINSVSQSDAYPLPTIQEILESLSGAVVFSTLDLNSGYWQVRMEEDSQDKTAFICSQGLFNFKVMAFGLKNAPATFQRLMERVLGELQHKNCFVYLDDIIIYSSSIEQHFQDIQAVLDKLKEANLTVNMKKTHFFRTSLKFLGHIVTATGIKADPEKTRAVQDFPVPKNIKEVQRFLGMAGWYHRFVPHFSQVAEPLNALKRKGVKFLWTSQCQTSFHALKQLLVSPPVLGHPNLNLPFVIYTDASEVGLGAVLVQQTGLGTEEVLAFASRTLNPAERNYTTTEQECLAVVWALEKWRYYLEGKFFTVVTDHSSLMWVFKTQKPNTCLIRWALLLQEFNFTVEYRKRKYNTVPDALSRAPVDINEPGLLTCSTALSLKLKVKSEKIEDLPISDHDIWKASRRILTFTICTNK
uniref:Reverse transcriptase domain-containing protein n=1 Tax=Cyprinus carpio TaxID=7962 RepID=A0A8C1GVQ7_CYPCA